MSTIGVSSLVSITLKTSEILAVEKILWKSEDPYVDIPIPTGNIIHQDIKPIEVNGYFTCKDPTELYNALEESGAINFTPITAIVKYKKTDGNIGTWTFIKWRVRTIEIEELSNIENPINFKVFFSAKQVQ